MENLSKIYRKPIEHLSNIYRTSIEHLTKIYRKSIERLSKIYRTSIEHLSNVYRTSIEHLSNIYRGSVEHLSNIYRRSIEFRSNHISGAYSASLELLCCKVRKAHFGPRSDHLTIHANRVISRPLINIMPKGNTLIRGRETTRLFIQIGWSLDP